METTFCKYRSLWGDKDPFKRSQHLLQHSQQMLGPFERAFPHAGASATMYERKVDVDMLNAVKSVLA